MLLTFDLQNDYIIKNNYPRFLKFRTNSSTSWSQPSLLKIVGYISDVIHMDYLQIFADQWHAGAQDCMQQI